MAQGTVKKGFFFYFGLFLLLLFAGFMVCLVIMMFNPGQTLLWMKYFTADETKYIATATSGESINYASMTSLTIKCDYADVVLEANYDSKYSKDGIYIINKAKGFAIANGAKDFGYKVLNDGGVVTIDLTEPSGFLFFSSDVKVVISTKKGWNTSNLELKVDATGDCDVYLGGDSNTLDYNVNLKSLNVETERGDIKIAKKFNCANVSGNSKLIAHNGKIYSSSDVVTFGNTNLTLGTVNGRINFKELNVGTRNLVLDNKSGAIAINKITANKIDVTCSQGNFYFETVNSDLSFANSKDTIISPVIDIKTMNGDFFIDATSYENSAPTVKIDTVNGKLIVLSSKGSVKANNVGGEVHIENVNEKGNGNMSVDVTIKDNNIDNIFIVSEAGNVKLRFKGIVSASTEVKTIKSKIEIFFTSVARFTTTAQNYSGTKALDNKKIDINIASGKISYDASSKNALVVEGTGSYNGNINVKTDNYLVYNLVDNI